ncbi:MAG: ArgK/MeaB family GTPase [Sphingomonadales bacterium]
MLDLDVIRREGKPGLAAALTALERDAGNAEVIDLLDAAFRAPKAHVIGLTGPPGVGKSTLMSVLIRHWRSGDRTVGVIAVDPSSRRTGGALLGDRTRLACDPADDGIFVRSMAARDKLGGLAAITVSAMVLMRAIYDIVLVETVGVGQSEADVVTVADTVILCIQPGSGDSLQFMKAGITEIPHITVVTKGDMGATAERTLADARQALGLAGSGPQGWSAPVQAVAAHTGDGVEELIKEIDRHGAWLDQDGRLDAARAIQAEQWLRDWVSERFGGYGVERAADRLTLAPGRSPFGRKAEIASVLIGATSAK